VTETVSTYAISACEALVASVNSVKKVPDFSDIFLWLLKLHIW